MSVFMNAGGDATWTKDETETLDVICEVDVRLFSLFFAAHKSDISKKQPEELKVRDSEVSTKTKLKTVSEELVVHMALMK